MKLEDQVENLAKETDITIKERSELGEVMDSLESDKFDPHTGSSSIDFNSRLSENKTNAIVRCEALELLGLFPAQGQSLTRKIKRLSVSINGQGRAEKVQVVQGERTNRTGAGVGERFMNWLRPQQ